MNRLRIDHPKNKILAARDGPRPIPSEMAPRTSTAVKGSREDWQLNQNKELTLASCKNAKSLGSETPTGLSGTKISVGHRGAGFG
jgi:hypothetical protein